MDTPDLMEILSRSGHHLADSVEGHLGDPVPTCPDWTVADLVHHLGGVESFWTAITAGTAPQEVVVAARPPDDELLDWFRASVDAAVARLGALDPAVPVWNWSGRDQTAGWVQRRMAQESVIHSWDGLNAVGAPEDIPTDIASDGIDEFLDVFVGALPARTDEPVETVHLHVTDGDGEWLLSTGGGPTTVARVHAKGDVAVRGPASDLDLALWSRRRSDRLEVIGEAAVFDRLIEWAKF